MYQTKTVMKTAARLFLIPVLFAFCFLFFTFVFKTPVLAAENYQPQPSSNQYLTPAANPNVPKNMHTYTQSVVIELMTSAVCQLAGYDPLSPNHKCLGIDPITNKIGFVENGRGLIGAMGGLIAMTYNMPTSSSQYVNYMVGNFGLTKKAYAANPCSTTANSENGVGFCSLQPLTGIWIKMRDVAYLLFTLIFIIIGLAIMLRVHIDPRTVMTLENQIPKIIIGILLVTFSLAIAGLLIDVMYVAIYLIGNVLISIAPASVDLGTNYPQIASSSSPIDAMKHFQTGDPGGIVGGAAYGIATLITNNITTITILTVDVGKVVAFIILFIVLLLAFWISLIRIWISLIMAYIMILLDVIFAPFWFLAGLLPGGALGVGAWFKDISANLFVFPTTIAMFALAIIFSKIGDTPSATGITLFNPPLVGGFGGSNTLTIGQLISFGFIFMTPQALSIVKSAIKAPKFNLGPVFSPAAAGVKTITGTAKGIGGTKLASEEMIMGKTGAWEQRGLGRSSLGRVFGR